MWKFPLIKGLLWDFSMSPTKTDQYNIQTFLSLLKNLKEKGRTDVEARLRKRDIADNKIAERQDAPLAILQANKLNDPETVRKRSTLMLPAP